jgi:hypothetical protein
MTARRNATGLALLIGASMLIAACGAAANTTAPSTTNPTAPPITEAPGSEPAATEGQPTFALPSFHAAVDLEKMIPSPIGGLPVQVLSMSGSQFASSGSDNEMAQALSQLGKQPSDLSVAFGSNANVTIFVFQVKGVPGSTVLDAFKAASPQSANVTQVSLGGKTVQKIVDASGDATYVYTVNDVIFTVVHGGTSAITDATLNEAFSKLP